MGPSHGNSGVHERNLPTDHPFNETHAEDHTRQTRVTVIGDTNISSSAMNFLSLGPSFSPARSINALTFRKVVGGLHRLRDALRARYRREHSPQTTTNQRIPSSVPFPQMFYKEPAPVPEVDVKLRILTSDILAVLRNHQRLNNNNLTYDQWKGFRELRELRSNGTIRISVSDKGGEFVIMPQSLDRGITELHLQDSSVYRLASAAEFSSQCKRLNHVWMTVGRSAGIDPKLISRLKLDNATCPVFYSLIKTHKLAPEDTLSMSPDRFKIRPIISCVGGPTDRISWFLNRIVSQLLVMVPAHLTNTRAFLGQLHNRRFDEGCIVESFDVTALYTKFKIMMPCKP